MKKNPTRPLFREKDRRTPIEPELAMEPDGQGESSARRNALVTLNLSEMDSYTSIDKRHTAMLHSLAFPFRSGTPVTQR